MNKLILIYSFLLAFILFSLQGGAQTITKKRQKVIDKDTELRSFLNDVCYCGKGVPCDVRKQYYQGNQFVSTYSMNRLIRQDLSKITLDEQGLPVIGNFASLKYSENDTKISLNASFANPFKKSKETDPIRWILSANIKASVSDGISSLFANKNASSGTGIKLKASFLSRKTQYVNESRFTCNTTKLYREYLFEDYINALAIQNAPVGVKRNDFLNKQQKLEKTILELEVMIKNKRQDVVDSLELARIALISDQEKFRKEKTTPLVDPNLNPDQLKEKLRLTNQRTQYELDKRERILKKQLIELPDLTVQSLQVARDDANDALISLNVEFRKFETEKIKFDSVAVIESAYARLLEIETKNIKWDYFKVKWFDIDLGLSGDKYKMYNTAAIVTEKLEEKSFSTWSAGFSFNYFESGRPNGNSRNGYFLKWGYYVTNDNNFAGTTPDKVVNTITKEDAGVKREIISETNAYKGPLIETFSHNAALHWSKYLNNKQSTSFDLYTTAKLGFDKNPVKVDKMPDWMLGTGVTFSLLDKDKASSYLNLQLFLNFSDLLNSAEDDKTQFYQRHQIGLKIGVPFDSLFINKSN